MHRSSLPDLATRAWASIAERRAGVPSGLPFAAVPDDRFVARCAVYQLIAEQTKGRSVLDLTGSAGYGPAILLAGGAREVTAVVVDRGLRSYAQRTYRQEGLRFVADLDAALAEIDAPEILLWVADGRTAPDDVLTTLDRLASPPSSMVVADGHWAAPSDRSTRASTETSSTWPSRFREHARARYLQVTEHDLLGPEGYAFSWTTRRPARARAAEYTLRRAISSATGAQTDAGSVVGSVVAASFPLSSMSSQDLRLHVGSGMERLEGWLNVDLLPLPGVDLVLDVTEEFGFDGVRAVYAEHFLEHLRVDQAVDFLLAVRRALVPGGLLRLSTPNLDYVWQTHYRRDATDEQKISLGLSINRAFYGWGHRFLWNRELLAHALETCGFGKLCWPAYGESEHELLRGLERHQRYPDGDGLAHVVIVEGSRDPEPPDRERIDELKERLNREIVDLGWEHVLTQGPPGATPDLGDAVHWVTNPDADPNPAEEDS